MDEQRGPQAYDKGHISRIRNIACVLQVLYIKKWRTPFYRAGLTSKKTGKLKTFL